MKETWQEELAGNVNTVEELSELLALDRDEADMMREVTAQFPMSISRYYLSLIDKGDPDDPIRRMALPMGERLDAAGALDTSGEEDNTVMPGVQHKYRQTVLILTTSQCAMYCRYCFRRRLVGLPGAVVAERLDDIVRYIEAHPEVNNVLLSGGDALLNSNERLDAYLSRLSRLEQLNYIRLGSRTPVTFPARITRDAELVDLLKEYGKKKQLYVVTHFNHPNECTPEARAAVNTLLAAGVQVKNQTVLLRGVNDNADTLACLMGRVTAMGVVPHYIFQCRPVKGIVNRFQVPIREGCDIVRGMMRRMDGLGKSADYVMSHPTGKIRILGDGGQGETVFQYKQAKRPSDVGMIFRRKLGPQDKWLYDI